MTGVFSTKQDLDDHRQDRHPGAKPLADFGFAYPELLCQPVAQGVWTVSRDRQNTERQNASELTHEDFPGMDSTSAAAQPKAKSKAKPKAKAPPGGYASAARPSPYNRAQGNTFVGPGADIPTNEILGAASGVPKVVIAGKKPAFPPVNTGPALPDFPEVAGVGKSQKRHLRSGAKHVPKSWGASTTPAWGSAAASSATSASASAKSQAKAKPKAGKKKGKFQDAFIKK